MASRWLILSAALLSACAPTTYEGPVSPHFDGSRFHNDPETHTVGFGDLLHWQLTAERVAWPSWVDWPSGAGPSVPPRRVNDDTVRITFVNHATTLVQMGGLNVLTDPVWSYRVGPTSGVGPARHHDPGVRFEDLPRIDAIVLSHDHYDHFDLPTLERISARDNPLVLAGLGTGALLTGAHVSRHDALDWWDCRPVGDGRICALPAQHNSRRGLSDGNSTLWESFWIETRSGTVYFAGDTGFGPHFERIRARMGAPCVALLPIGAYLPRWFMEPNHMSPADAVRAHDILGASTSVAIHIKTFEQSDEGMDQPKADLFSALRSGVHAPFVVPEFGEQMSFRCAPQ